MQFESNEYHPVLTEMISQDMQEHVVTYKSYRFFAAKWLVMILLLPLLLMSVIAVCLTLYCHQDVQSFVYLSPLCAALTLFVCSKICKRRPNGMTVGRRILFTFVFLIITHLAIPIIICIVVPSFSDKPMLIAGLSIMMVSVLFLFYCWLSLFRFILRIPSKRIEATKDAIAAFQNREWYRGVSLANKAIGEDAVLDAYLIICSAFGLGGLPKDPRCAFERASASARRRSLIHMRILAWMYYVGIGTEKDEIRATELLNEYRLARQGGVSD